MRQNETDIFRIDNICITGGIILTASGLLLYKSLISPVLVILFAGGIFSLATGIYYRVLEKKVSSLLKNLKLASEVYVPDIMSSMGYSEKQIFSILNIINRKGLGFYVHDKEANTIYDARLRRKIVSVNSCPSCGSTIQVQYTPGAGKVPICPYCSSPVTSEKFTDIKMKILEEINNDSRQKDPGRYSHIQEKKFSMAVFILLLMFFWPGAFLYAYFRRYDPGSPFSNMVRR